MTAQQKEGEEIWAARVDRYVDQFHSFWLLATPVIFEWFNWVAVLGALTFIYNKHPTFALVPLLALGYVGLIFYFGAFFAKHPLKISVIRNKATANLVSGLLATALGFAANRLVALAVAAFAKGSP